MKSIIAKNLIGLSVVFLLNACGGVEDPGPISADSPVTTEPVTTPEVPATDSPITTAPVTTPVVPATDNPVTTAPVTTPVVPATDSPITTEPATTLAAPATDSPVTTEPVTTPDAPATDSPIITEPVTTPDAPAADSSLSSDYLQITGAGIKGPLALADVKIFALDPSLPDFYDKSSPIASAITNEYAEIDGLYVPRNILPPYVLTVGGNNAIDLNTGKAPVISTLITVITEDMLADNRPIYATPLTTLVFYMAAQSASASASTDTNFFVQQIKDASTQVSQMFAIDQNTAIDVLRSPLVINDATVTLAAQQEAVHHRAAVEAFAAKLHNLSLLKGDGLQATYYNDLTFTNAALKRVDANINFDWQLEAPDATVNADVFSVRWKGLIEPQYSETYTFYTSTDDGVRLWVDGQLIVDNWADQAETEFSGTITLTAGHKYPIVMEYYDNTGGAVAKLLWSSPSQPKSAVAKESLYSVTDPTLLENITPDTLIERLARDLQSDGVIDNSANGTMIGGIDATILNQDPLILTIPNTAYLVGDIMTLMVEERASIGTDTGPTFLVDSIVFGNQSSFTLSVDNLDFGSQIVGGTSDPLSLTLTNNGTGPLTLSGISISSGFTETNNCIDNLPVSGNCIIDVQFVPTAAGDAIGTLTVTDSTTGSPYVVSLAGIGRNVTLPSNLIDSGPIVMSGEQDVVISGLHISNPNGHCIEIGNYSAKIVIKDSEIGPCRDSGINITFSQNITIQNNYIHDTGYVGVYSNEAHTITVDNNRIETVASGYGALTNRIDGVFGSIVFTNNYVKNVTRNFNWPAAGGNCVFLAYIEGGGIRLNDNTCINELGKSDPEDIFNIYWTKGLDSDPVQVLRNRIKGGGPSASGGGIIVGDGGGSNTIISGNTLVDPGQYGLAVAGGFNHTITNNKVFAKNQDFTRVGIYVWRQATPPGTCYSIHVESNEVNWTSGINGGAQVPEWTTTTGADDLSPNCGDIIGWDNNNWYSNIDSSIWDNAWDIPPSL